MKKRQEETPMDMTLAVTSPAFADGGEIPARYAGTGEDISPPRLSAPSSTGRSGISPLYRRSRKTSRKKRKENFYPGRSLPGKKCAVSHRLYGSQPALRHPPLPVPCVRPGHHAGFGSGGESQETAKSHGRAYPRVRPIERMVQQIAQRPSAAP